MAAFSPAEREFLENQWKAGTSQTTIAALMNRPLGSIVGYLSRNKLYGTERASPTALRERSEPRAREKKPTVIKAVKCRMAGLEDNRRLALLPDLYVEPPVTLPPLGRETCPGGCKWPIGDPQSAEFGFCCRPAVERYCNHHAELSRPAAMRAPPTQARQERMAERADRSYVTHRDRPLPRRAASVMDSKW